MLDGKKRIKVIVKHQNYNIKLKKNKNNEYICVEQKNIIISSLIDIYIYVYSYKLYVFYYLTSVLNYYLFINNEFVSLVDNNSHYNFYIITYKKEKRIKAFLIFYRVIMGDET